MDYEKKYNEALEMVRRLHDRMLVLSSTDALVASAELEFIFPELAESEDERIRKELKEAFEAYDIESKWNGIPIRSILAWLEKQKENPKSADFIPADCTSLAKCEDRDSKYGVFPEDVLVVARACEKLEAHDYPELAYALKNVNLYTKPVDYDHEMWKNCEANFEGGKKEVIDHPEKYGLQKEQKPVEWSEEDEEMIERLIRHTQEEFDELCNDRYGHQEIISDLKESCRERMRWLEKLKSLRPSWKPSEEQMKALQNAVALTACDKELARLYNQLKKL